jgi:pSer/pThr/pTyr-binding forkhead associated (FHA) protein
LTLQSSRGSATARLSALDLELGVLVGRAPKCNDALRKVLDNGISRVHLLLRRGVAYDLASTQGTYVYGRRVRSAFLGDAAEICLGAVNTVRMHVRTLPG